MQDKDITATILAMDDEEINEILGLLATEEIIITHPPQTGLLMMTVTDSFLTEFHLGEVLTTRAEVLFSGETGYGMVIGEEPRKALVRAVVDALMKANRPENLYRRVISCLEQAHSHLMAVRAGEAAVIASTRVSFDLMP
jgi:alpha-D-ribose 1-methylphosphonate 5-triphosphate synthase subunit PhnG